MRFEVGEEHLAFNILSIDPFVVDLRINKENKYGKIIIKG